MGGKKPWWRDDLQFYSAVSVKLSNPLNPVDPQQNESYLLNSASRVLTSQESQ